MSTDSSKVCPTDKATLAASLKQLCTGTNAYSKAQQALKACEGPEEGIGPTPIYGTCGLKWSTKFCGNEVTPFVQVPTNFVNVYTGVGTGGTGAGVQIQVTSSIIQNVIFTATITDINGTPVIVKCLGVPTVIPGSVFFDRADDTVTITVTIPFNGCTSTGTYFFKLCGTTDNGCITCIMGSITISNDLFIIGVSTWIPHTMEVDGISYGSLNDSSGPWACSLGETECPNTCIFPCTLLPDVNIYSIVVTTNILSNSFINITASGSCPAGADCCYGGEVPNCGLLTKVYFNTGGSVPYSIGLGSNNLVYGLCLQNLAMPGFLSILHDLAFGYTSLFVKAEDCQNKHSATLVIYTLVDWFHCYISS